MNDVPLTSVGIIAALLGLFFAGMAFFNSVRQSRMQRKGLDASGKPLKEPKPYHVTDPFSAPTIQTPESVAKSASAATAPKRKEPAHSAVFRQLNAKGLVEATDTHKTRSDLYIWE